MIKYCVSTSHNSDLRRIVKIILSGYNNYGCPDENLRG